MTTRDENRAAFPQMAQILDMFRETFGDGVRITYARENGREVGRRDDSFVAREWPCAERALGSEAVKAMRGARR